MNEQMMNHIDLVNKIIYMMEYMTLCADPTLFEKGSDARRYPAPNGVPMIIMSAPDFVVDVAVDGIADSGAASCHRIEPLDVGGRAGRLAWVLQDFGGQRNGWYGIKYVAKAGDVGRVVLRRRFVKGNQRTRFDPVSLRYLIPSKKDYDWLHVFGDKLGASPVESSYRGLDLTIGDFDESPYSLTDLFVDVRYIVLASKHADHAINAMSVVAEGLKRLSRMLPEQLSERQELRVPIGIMVDLSAMEIPEDADRVVRAFADLKGQASAFDLDSTALCDQGLDFEAAQFKHVLVRGAGTAQLRGATEEIEVNIKDPLIRESLTSVYVIASACDLGWRLLRGWYHYFPRMRPIDGRGHESFPERLGCAPGQPANPAGLLPSLLVGAGDPIAPVDRLQFAALLAQSTGSRPLHYRELIRAVEERRPCPLQQPIDDVSRSELDYAKSEDKNHEQCQQELEKQALGINNLTRRFNAPHAAGTLSLFVPPSSLGQFAASCLLRDLRREATPPRKGIEKAVMFDLDATLIDSAGLLRACWFKGLQTFFNDVQHPISSEGIRAVVDMYQSYVYDNHDRFRSLLRDLPDIPPEWQPCDFRQVWNHPYAWAALLWLLHLKPDSKSGDWQQALEIHEDWKSSKLGKCKCGFCVRLEPRLDKCREDIGRRRHSTRHLREVLTSFKLAIQSGMRDFWEVDYPCFPQVRSCIETLRATPGCEVYVVTEGHEETQLQKLKCVGLDDLIPKGRVLSTGGASSAELVGSDLSKLFIIQTMETMDQLVTIHKAGGQIGTILAMKDAAFGSIQFLADLLHTLRSKAHKRFACAVIDAIRLRPESPAEVLQSFLERTRRARLSQEGGGDPDEVLHGGRSV